MKHSEGQEAPAVAASYGISRVEEGEATWRFAVSGSLPRAVVRPASSAEVGEVVRRTRERGECLIPVGKGVRLGIGNRPRQYDIALSTELLNSVEAHRSEDMTVTVQAGMTLGRLNEALAAGGQWLPLDPAAGDETTVGGLIAADASGPMRHAYGKVRDFLLGVELVSGAGEIVRAGGRVVKNVAGYDVTKLVCGSFGSLGVVVSATFKTRPLPAIQRIYVWPCSDLAEAIGRATALDGGHLGACVLEALSGRACEAIGIECAAALVVGVAGSPADVDQQHLDLTATSGGAARACSADKASGLLQAIRNFSLPVHDEAIVARIATRRTDLADLLARVEHEAGSRGVEIEIAAHAVVGVARCQIFGRGEGRRLSLFAEWLRLSVRQRGGWVIYEAMPGELRGVIDAWGFHEPTVDLMRGVKNVFDPAGVLSPGRFVGGI